MATVEGCVVVTVKVTVDGTGPVIEAAGAGATEVDRLETEAAGDGVTVETTM